MRAEADDEVRTAFVGGLSFPLDPFQARAFDALDAGRSVLVAAPTGSGKTLVAEYAVERAFRAGRRAFYTTPLKALSNQKFGDLGRRYGPERVGLLTGDVTRNPQAPIVVMTTEVLRNMIYAQPGRLGDLGCVVLDEVHYLEDRYRGSVWEEIILSAPREVALVCLSATVSNAEELASWMAQVRGEVVPIIEEHRPIELRQLYVVDDRRGEGLVVLPTFVDGAANPEAVELDRRAARLAERRARSGHGRAGRGGGPSRPRRADVVQHFRDADLLPAIYFIFSRAGCDDALRQCSDEGIRLTTTEERRAIREVLDRHVDALSDADLRVLGYARFAGALEAGIAAHHAGLVPPFREAVEELFAAALVKVVFATETLALGINMPARSVIVEALSKFNGAGHDDLAPGEFTQLTGRAGRRGIDAIGYAAVLYSPYYRFEDVAALASSRSGPLSSSFRPTPNMATNLVRRHPRDEAYRLVRSSFAQYQSDVPLTRQLDRVLELLAARGYVEGWSLTPAGERLAGIYHECDLLIADVVEAGLLDGLDAPELAAVCSMFTFEARRGQTRLPLPTSRVARRAEAVEAVAEDLRRDERRLGLPPTRALDSGFGALAYAWAKGSALGEVLRPPRDRRRRAGEQAVMSGGDFVRNVKQLLDLLRQVGSIGGSERLRQRAERAVDSLNRGLVAVSGAPLEELLEDADDELDDDERERAAGADPVPEVADDPSVRPGAGRDAIRDRGRGVP